MEKHRCKLCSRTFTNGRALGGHMKGHLAALPPKFTSSWSSEEESKLANPQFSAVFQDKESELQSRKPTRKRSKRTRKSAFPHKKSLTSTELHSPPVSSISDESAEEDVAMCLIMLSRDKWTTNQENNVNKFECEKCKKKFRSSKALAGHKATHSKNRDDADDKFKNFECPFCFKVFGSGQALGGHKRSHLLLGHHVNVSTAASCSSSVVNNSTVKVLIDLNLPAPAEEEDDEYSVVSEVKIIQC